MEVSNRALDEAEVAAAGQTLADAFHDDPLQVHVFPDPVERARCSPAQFAILVREGCLFGEVHATQGLTGLSVWLPPGNVVTPEKAAQSGFQQLPELMGRASFERFGLVLDYLSSAHGKVMPAAHWYLMLVGVRPDRQGGGQGRALLAPIMARADAAGVPICLDTAQEKVKPFYERLGFRVLLETVDPASGLRLWTYQRDPVRTAAARQ